MRISFDGYGMALADVAAKRSEDPFRQVGAVGFDGSNRIVSMGYNGLPAGITIPDAVMADREHRQRYMIHAETNLLTKCKIGEVLTVYITTMPCTECFKNLVAHGVSRVVYRDDYAESHAPELAGLFGIKLENHHENYFSDKTTNIR